MTRFAPILLTAIAATIGLSSARAVGLNPQGVTARQDPYDIQWSFLSSEVGGEFVHFGAPVNGLWQDIVDRSGTTRGPTGAVDQVMAGVLREGGADGDLARCWLNDLNFEVPHRQFVSIPEGQGLVYQVCCYYEMKSNGPIEPEPPRCCHSEECNFAFA